MTLPKKTSRSISMILINLLMKVSLKEQVFSSIGKLSCFILVPQVSRDLPLVLLPIL